MHYIYISTGQVLVILITEHTFGVTPYCCFVGGNPAPPSRPAFPYRVRGLWVHVDLVGSLSTLPKSDTFLGRSRLYLSGAPPRI